MSNSCPIPTLPKTAREGREPTGVDAVLKHNYGDVARGRAELRRLADERWARQQALAEPEPPDSYPRHQGPQQRPGRRPVPDAKPEQKARLNQAVAEAWAILEETGDRLATILHLFAAGIWELDTGEGVFIRRWKWTRGGYVQPTYRALGARNVQFRFPVSGTSLIVEGSTLAWALCWRVPVPAGFQLARVNGDRRDHRPENIRLATLAGQRWG